MIWPIKKKIHSSSNAMMPSSEDIILELAIDYCTLLLSRFCVGDEVEHNMA